MQSKWLFPAAIAVSLLIHLCFLLFLHLSPDQEKDKNAEDEPVEVSLIPKEKPPVPEPVPRSERAVPIPEPPETDPEETTLEHDLPGGRTKGEDKPKETPKPAPRPTPKPVPAPKPVPGTAGKPAPKPAEPAVEEPKFGSEETLPVKEPEITREPESERDVSGLFNTRDITDRIANSKPELPKGEDTASYNAFEQKYASYFGKFRRRIYQLWQYPRNAAMRGESGVVGVTFSILKDGSVVNIKMTRSSGYPELDREVMRVLKNVGKIPLPSSYELDQLNVDEASFIYTIGGGYGRYIE